MPEASLDKAVGDFLAKLRRHPLDNADEIADGLIDAMKKSTILSGTQKREILKSIVHAQIIFRAARRNMILQYLVDVTEKEIEPKALAFLFILQDIYYRPTHEQ